MATPKPKLNYDNEADVLYVSFGTGEPSYCDPLSNFLLLELGMFTNQPTGFRVIQPRKRDIKEIVLKIEKTVHRRITEGTQQRKEFIRKTLAQVQKTKDLVKVA